ncbi:hypothetical protein CPB85DRAFT_1324217, partial [Mucidula mucida]
MAYLVAIAATVGLFLFCFLIVGLVNLLTLIQSPPPDANTTCLQRLHSLFMDGYIVRVPGRDFARCFIVRMATYTAPSFLLDSRLPRGLFGSRREAQNTSN